MKRNKSKIKARFKKKQTICWSCKKALGYCSWSKCDKDTSEILFQPVDGWVAEKTILLMYRRGGKSRYETSYIVESCPQYEGGEKDAVC